MSATSKVLLAAASSVSASPHHGGTPPDLPAPQPQQPASLGRSHRESNYASAPSTPSVAHTPHMTPERADAVSGAATARRPSPWHQIAHSLSTTPLLPRSRGSSMSSLAGTPPTAPLQLETDGESQALRHWERLLAAPDSDATRHTLVPLPVEQGSPHLPPCGTPKLAAERDKDGHIEYKLKLIDPSSGRFEKLVTQMMWRLKQGKNEAIYELGLADDGTVIGLTRAEMDASLRTLERMASEVGATVIVLKEIVLPPALPLDISSQLSSSLSSSGSAPGSAATPPMWWARRPDLDQNGKPRKGTRSLGGVMPEVKTKLQRKLEREERAADPFGFGWDDEPTPFQLDLDDGSSSTASSPVVPVPPSLEALAQSRAEAKRRKAAARCEQRRLDLLRGDGTSMPPIPLPGTRLSLPGNEATSGAAALIAANLHQPARPSSLRLARTHSGMAMLGAEESATALSPSPSTAIATATTERQSPPASPDNSGTPPGDVMPDDQFIDALSLPLDSLSLSFADVTTVDDAHTAGAQTVVGSPDDRRVHMHEEETICVEALVVRKQDDWGYGPTEDDGWGFGGDDDGWGFGGDE